MVKQTILRAILLIISLTLTACQLSSPQPEVIEQGDETERWNHHQQSLKELTKYQARGSFAYLTSKQKISAQFFWQQYSVDRYRLLLTTPFGGKIVELNVNADRAQLTDGKNQIYLSRDPEELILRLTNMNIPLNNLRQLLIGLPGQATHLQFNQENYLQRASLKQGNQLWQIDYHSYHTKLTLALPKYIQLKQEDQTIKLNVNKWTLE